MRNLVSVALLLCLLAGAAPAGDDVMEELLRKLGRAEDPKERMALVGRLVARHSHRAAARLARIVEEDENPAVRAEAAAGLGRIRADNAEELLLRSLAVELNATA